MGTEWDKEVVAKVDPQKRVLCLAEVFSFSQVKNLKANKMGNLPKVRTLGKAQGPGADSEAHIFTCKAVLPRKHVRFYSHLNTPRRVSGT